MRIVVIPGVLRPPSDMRLLAAVMRDQAIARQASVLDVFTGSGALAIEAALAGARSITATDISRRAVLNAQLNALLNRVRVRVRRGNLFEPVAGERFELILANPPYLPGANEALSCCGAARAWEGGAGGRALLDPFCRQAVEHLVPRGRVLIVHSSLSDERRSLELLAASGLKAEVLVRRAGPLGPIAAGRAEMYERQGVLASGERVEDLVVICGRRPG